MVLFIDSKDIDSSQKFINALE